MDEYPGDVRLFINGSPADGTGDGRQQVRSPVSGDVIGSVPVPGHADIDAAVAAANAAQPRWGRTGVWERAKICHAIGDALTARCEELARLQTLEQGKPLQESRDDIAEAATLFHLHAEDAVLAETDVVRPGNPFDARTTLGPLNNEAVAAKMDRHVADGDRRGADLLRGGQRRAGQPTDLYYEFTIADRVPLDSLYATEESFGPVVPIITADSEEDLLGIANSDQLGLQAAVFTRNISKAYRFVEELEVGQVVVNDSTCWWDINMPFGGAGGRRTGWGRIGGKHTLLGMTDLRTAAIHL